MRVAVYHNLPPGGALRMLHEFLRRTRSEHEYDLYTLDLGHLDSFAYARDRAEPCHLEPHVARSFRYPALPGWAAQGLADKAWWLTSPHWMDQAQRRVAADIDRRGYDVVLVHPCWVTHTPGLLRHLTVPSVHYMQEHRRRSFEAGYQPPRPGTGLLHRAGAAVVERAMRADDMAAARAATTIMCNSFYSAECIKRSYGRDATVCYPGVDTDVFDLAPGPAPKRMSVLSVGSLERFKAHILVVHALGLLAPSARPSLDLVYERCDRPYQGEVVALAAATGVDLRLHPGISDARLAELYGTASATVVAADLEPFGLVPLESLACGTPVVAVREAGYRETVDHGVNGYLVDRTAAGIAEALAQVLAGSLHRDPEQVRRTVVPGWGWDTSVKRQLAQLAATASEPRR